MLSILLPDMSWVYLTRTVRCLSKRIWSSWNDGGYPESPPPFAKATLGLGAKHW